jgi:hypothetical protein
MAGLLRVLTAQIYNIFGRNKMETGTFPAGFANIPNLTEIGPKTIKWMLL